MQSKDQKWQQYWKENNVFKVDLLSNKPKYYVMDMFPYPSGSGLHVGHLKGYTATDIVARYKKQKGFEVLHPMGFDAFGLPAEQFAIKTGNSPREFTMHNIQNFKKQLNMFGFAYDWDREVITSEEWFYKHTQWIFAQLYKHKLAEIKEISVNWSPSLNTVLSNEELLDGPNGTKVAERDGLPVEQKVMKQWVLNITKYADRLFHGVDKLDWPDSLKSLQKNWIYTFDENGHKTLHLRDWVFARQRYWGEPFPIIHGKDGQIHLIPEIEYPVKLPHIKNYSFTKDGKPALASATEWVHTPEGEREVNTMPQWAGSCWYYIGYLLKQHGKEEILGLNTKEAKALLDKWLSVDLYIGGQEHAVTHLIYARFWHLFLHDIGVTKIEEPFKRMFTLGMILGPDGTKMSKSKGNVVLPDDIASKYNADSLRMYEMFMGPLNEEISWNDDGVKNMFDWLNRVNRMYSNIEIVNDCSNENKIAFNKLIEKVEANTEALKHNVSISELMVFVNAIYKDNKVTKAIADGFAQILSLYAPFTAEELWQTVLGHNKSVYLSSWPHKYEISQSELIHSIAIQVNGKLKDVVKVSHKVVESITKKIELTNLHDHNHDVEVIKNIIKHSNKLDNLNVKNIIYIPHKILNIVIPVEE